MSLKQSYLGAGKIILTYWRAYVGFSSLAVSPYVHFAAIFTVLLTPKWIEPGWWDLVYSIIPSLMGFSLGGYAIWLALGNDEFRKIISGRNPGEETSPFMEVNAAFVHFIFLQVVSLLYATIADAYSFSASKEYLIDAMGSFGSCIHTFIPFVTATAWFFGFFLFIYSLVAALAATFSLLRVSSWYDKFEELQADQKLETAQQEKDQDG